VARLALESGAPVVPVAMLNSDEIQPTGQIIPNIKRVRIRFGPPMDFSRYAGMAGDRFVERAVTDEIMYELMELSGREYVDVYAQKVKAAPKPAETESAEPAAVASAGD
jgi:1-acyl-sn-glycerol-3-phosphate acyltransferase